MSWAELLLSAALLVSSPDGDVAAQLEEARLAIRRGDLALAERTLERIDRAAASERELALLALNEGNVDFWGRDLEQARAHFERSRESFSALDALDPGSERAVLDVLEGNLALVAAELERAERLRREQSRLVTWLLTVGVLAAVAVALLVRGSRMR